LTFTSLAVSAFAFFSGVTLKLPMGHYTILTGI